MVCADDGAFQVFCNYQHIFFVPNLTAAYKWGVENPKLWDMDEEASDIVRHIYKLRMDGLGIEKIAERLRAEKVYSPNTYAII